MAIFQVLLMLSSDLEDNDRDRAALSKVLSTCLEELKLDQMVTLFSTCWMEYNSNLIMHNSTM